MLAHRACGQKSVISEAFRVDHAYLDIAVQPIVLEAIVADDGLCVRVARQQRLRRVDAVCVDKDRYV